MWRITDTRAVRKRDAELYLSLKLSQTTVGSQTNNTVHKQITLPLQSELNKSLRKYAYKHRTKYPRIRSLFRSQKFKGFPAAPLEVRVEAYR